MIKTIIIISVSILLIGLCDGFIELLKHHYKVFKAKFPKVDDQYFNPAISWQNKWKNEDNKQGEKFIFSSNLFVFTTDAYHLFRSIKKQLIIFAIAYLYGYNILLVILILNIIHTLGFYITYKLV